MKSKKKSRQQTAKLIGATRSHLKRRLEFRVRRAAAVAALKQAARATHAARVKIETLLAATAEKIAPADQALTRLEELSDTGLTGSSQLIDTIEQLQKTLAEVADDLIGEIEQLSQSAKDVEPGRAF